MRTYGTVHLGENKGGRICFVVRCEPHITMRLKRTFAKLAAGSAGDHYLSDTPDTARDLLWFMDRFPLVPTNEALRRLRKRCAEQKENEAIVEAMLSRRGEAQAFELAVPAREYQRVAATLVLKTGALLLADQVGLGKTCSAICVLTDPTRLPALVVTMTHLPTQWEREVKRFAPRLRTHIIAKGTPYDVTLGKDAARKQAGGGDQLLLPGKMAGEFPDVVIINYHKLAAWSETLAPLIRTLIFDEAQELRHEDSNKYRGALHLAEHASTRLGLTATPVYNYGGEIYNVLEIIKPGQLGAWDEFAREWCAYSSERKKAQVTDPVAFGRYLRETGTMLRRTRSDVGRELPPVSKIAHTIESDPAALNAVRSDALALARTILKAGGGLKKLQAAQEFSMLLRQATGIAKAPYVAAFVRMLVESGEPVVLYAWHRAVYAILAEALTDLGIVFYTGHESTTAKQESFDKFARGEAKILCISLRAGAGLDGLQHVCRTVVFGELDWSPGVHEQDEGRVARDGQKDPVLVYYLLAEDGSDPVVADVLQIKTSQIEGLRDPDGLTLEEAQIDPNHVRKLAERYMADHAAKVSFLEGLGKDGETDGQVQDVGC